MRQKERNRLRGRWTTMLALEPELRQRAIIKVEGREGKATREKNEDALIVRLIFKGICTVTNCHELLYHLAFRYSSDFV